jgi:hypothetical protein
MMMGGCLALLGLAAALQFGWAVACKFKAVVAKAWGQVGTGMNK